ncbi:MAG: helix-turn-helix transcriptional regulator [Desulfitobacteriaceae bacterium]
MERDEFIELISSKIRITRVEADLTQDRMAEILGISKKTLVQIEKGRVQASWPLTVTFCTLFRDSELLRSFFGNNLIEIISVLAFKHYDGSSERTMGGRIWWRDIDSAGSFRLQQNLVSKHFRILDEEDRRWCSSFDEEDMRKRLSEISCMT